MLSTFDVIINTIFLFTLIDSEHFIFCTRLQQKKINISKIRFEIVSAMLKNIYGVLLLNFSVIFKIFLTKNMKYKREDEEQRREGENKQMVEEYCIKCDNREVGLIFIFCYLLKYKN